MKIKNIFWINDYNKLHKIFKLQNKAINKKHRTVDTLFKEIGNLKYPVLKEVYNPLKSQIDKDIESIHDDLSKMKATRAKMKDIEDNWNIINSSLLLIATFALANVIVSWLANEEIEKIKTEFYVVTAGLIPVFLIALSIYSNKQTLTKKAYISEILSTVIPIFVGLLACLLVIATGKSNPYLFWFALSALIQLMVDFITKGIKKTIPSNPLK